MVIDKKILSNKLNKNLRKRLSHDAYKVSYKNPIELLVPERFDLLAKFIYVKFVDQRIESNFGKELYLAHINAFNSFFENDESQKIGRDAFLETFNKVIKSIKNNGFNKEQIIPTSQGVILDGAHRIATSIYYRQKIPCVEVEEISPPNFNYEFFENRGLGRVYLDTMATEYAKLKDDVYIVLIWPSADGKEKELLEILNDYGKIVYRKNVYLTSEGSVQLIRKVYKNEKWVGDGKNSFVGARNKAQWCFDKKGPVRVFLFESNNDLIEMKEKIRKLYNVGKHSVHINDTKEETLELAGLLFNENSIHWMNFAVLREFKWFNNLFTHYKMWLQKEKLNKENFCIDGSSTLALYGIREARDLDYLCFGKEVLSGFKEIGCHNKEMKYHPIAKDEIIFNPKNHLVVDGIKFISIENIKQMKQNRNEEKDIKDVEMINKVLTRQKIAIPFHEKVQNIIKLSYWKGKTKFLLLKLRFYITKRKNNI